MVRSFHSLVVYASPIHLSGTYHYSFRDARYHWTVGVYYDGQIIATMHVYVGLQWVGSSTCNWMWDGRLAELGRYTLIARFYSQSGF